MFQTGLIAWMQSFSTPWLDSVMRSVSFIGNGEVIAATLIVLIFGFRFRLGMTILLSVLIGSAIANSLKNVFEYPRPVFLSAKVGEPGDHSSPPTVFDNGGGESFWSLPKSDAISAVRKIHRERGLRADGLPSGHVTTAVTLSFGVALLFGGLRYIPIAIGWSLMMALSRMYLGRHFLADVLLGALIGILCVLFSLWVTRSFRNGTDGQSWITVAIIGVTASVASLLPVAEIDHLGEVAGLCAGILLVIGIGVPADDAPIVKRVLRVALGATIYVGTQFLLSHLDIANWVSAADFFDSLLSIAITCFATVLIGKQFDLFEERKVANPH